MFSSVSTQTFVPAGLMAAVILCVAGIMLYSNYINTPEAA